MDFKERMASFDNSYVQGRNEYAADEANADVFESVTIDGYPADENGQGESVAIIFITVHGDIVIDWRDNGYRMNDKVLALLEESRLMLVNDFQNAGMGKKKKR